MTDTRTLPEMINTEYSYRRTFNSDSFILIRIIYVKLFYSFGFRERAARAEYPAPQFLTLQYTVNLIKL